MLLERKQINLYVNIYDADFPGLLELHRPVQLLLLATFCHDILEKGEILTVCSQVTGYEPVQRKEILELCIVDSWALIGYSKPNILNILCHYSDLSNLVYFIFLKAQPCTQIMLCLNWKRALKVVLFQRFVSKLFAVDHNSFICGALCGLLWGFKKRNTLCFLAGWSILFHACARCHLKG